jgi:hypothetical protein
MSKKKEKEKEKERSIYNCQPGIIQPYVIRPNKQICVIRVTKPKKIG